MKKRKDSPALPSVTKEDVQRQLPKKKAILLRLSESDKDAIDTAAKSVHLTATEYLVTCHRLVSTKLK